MSTADVETPLPEYTPEPQPRTYKELVIEKVVRDGGPYPVGHIITYTYKSWTRDDALRHLGASLKRQGEDRGHWHLLEPTNA